MEGKRKLDHGPGDRESQSLALNNSSGSSSNMTTKKISVQYSDDSCNTRDRSAFELSESGAIDLLVDTLQFHLDGLYSLTASKSVKTRSLAKIVQTVAMIPAISLQASGLVGKLSMLLNLLRTESDDPTRFGLLNLAFIICVDDLGLFNVPLGLNADIFECIVRVIASDASGSSVGALSSPSKSPTPSSPPEAHTLSNSCNSTINSVSNSTKSFHSKRVFKNRPVQVHVEASALDPTVRGVPLREPPASGFHSKRVFKRGNGVNASLASESHSLSSAACASSTSTVAELSMAPPNDPPQKNVYDEFVKNVSFLSPQLCQTLLGRSSLDISLTSILSLLLVNRIITSVVQNSTRSSALTAVYSKSLDDTSSSESKVVVFQKVCMHDAALTSILSVLEASLCHMRTRAVCTRLHDKSYLINKILSSAGVARAASSSPLLAAKDHDSSSSSSSFSDAGACNSDIDEVLGASSSSNNNNNNSSWSGRSQVESVHKNFAGIWSEIWLCVGIIDALCFRNSENQAVLSSRSLAVGENVSLPVALLELLNALNVHLLAFIETSLEKTTENVNMCDDEGDRSSSLHSPAHSSKFSGSPFSPEQTASTCRHFTLEIDSDSIGCYEVFISCLKSLISLSHRCNEACCEILASKGLDTIVEYLDIFYSLRYRLNEKLLREGEVYDRSLSPQETIVERILFDGIVCLLTLLTNLLEYDKEGSTFCDYFLRLTYEFTRCPIGLLHGGLPQNPITNDTPLLLSFMLLRESSVFMIILEETENSLLPDEQRKDVADAKVDGNDRIPISEIIVSAHICLLIHSILYIKQDTNTSEGNHYSVDKARFLQYLPRQSFWLPIRILKAFLTLQEKTEVLILDNMAPVLNVINIMSSE